MIKNNDKLTELKLTTAMMTTITTKLFGCSASNPVKSPRTLLPCRGFGRQPNLITKLLYYSQANETALTPCQRNRVLKMFLISSIHLSSFPTARVTNLFSSK
jgi:hypothetical protein